MSDIYLSLTETPTVVTLSQPVVSGVLSSNVTVTNVVSVNVVTMPAINVTAAAPSVTTVAGSVAVSNFPSVTTVAGTVALDANSLSALENVTVTVGAAVSVSNFPSTQTIAGTVTANVAEPGPGVSTFISESGSFSPAYAVGIGYNTANNAEFLAVNDSGNNFPVAVNNSVTIGSLPAISGTVTANLGGYSQTAVSYSSSSVTAIPVALQTNGVYGGTLLAYNGANTYLRVGLDSVGGNSLAFGGSVPISGTVTVSNSVTIGSLPAISGTVTAAAPNGSLTTRFGTPTTANVSFATSAVTNANRKYLLIQNVTTGSNVITVGIGFTPTTTQGIQLTAGAGITFESSYIPTGAVYVLSSVTASNFTILEA